MHVHVYVMHLELINTRVLLLNWGLYMDKLQGLCNSALHIILYTSTRVPYKLNVNGKKVLFNNISTNAHTVKSEIFTFA